MTLSGSLLDEYFSLGVKSVSVPHDVHHAVSAITVDLVAEQGERRRTFKNDLKKLFAVPKRN